MQNRVIAIVSVLGLALAACGSEKGDGPVQKPTGETAGDPATPGGGGDINLTGAGATFPYPLYSKWMHEYEKVDPRVKINYQSIGSGGGIKQITAGTVDFGASDDKMKESEMKQAPAPLLHIPTTVGAVVLAYNVRDVPQGLKLTPEAIAGIYLGEIKKWNDPAIAGANPDAKLLADDIHVAYRSDGSGTTAVFTDYLSNVSPAWKEKVGYGKSVKFPVGLGAKGNEGVAGQIKTTPGTIGYVELAYAKQTGLTYAHVKNKAGNFVEPSIESISHAAGALPDDLATSIVNGDAPDAYPISAFTYILVYEDMKDPTKAKALAQFLWWAIHDGQKFGADLHYAPLPAEAVTKIEAKLKTLKAKGQPLL